MWKYIGTQEAKDFLISLRLIDCSDENKYIKTLYTISNNIKEHYKIYKIKKKNGKERTIFEPSEILKYIQRRILKVILNNKSISSYAKAYHKNISLVDNAVPHVNKKYILKLDIKDFFDNINFYDIYNSCFQLEYFPKHIGMLLTYLCTYENHLIQGAPTSAYISNLVMKEFDNELGDWCHQKNISYTRYSDDMTFSGDFSSNEVIEKVKEMLKVMKLSLNTKKIHFISSSASQNVTGIVVNQKAQVSSNYRKKIRQEIYYIKTYGLDSHLNRTNNNISIDEYINSLYGKILYVLQINPNDLEFIKYKEFITDHFKSKI